MYKDRIFKLSELSRIFGVNRHLIINLVERGIISPLEDATGRGRSRLYSYANVVQIGIFLQLTKLNLSYSRASHLLSIVKSMIARESFEGLHYICVVGFVGGESQELNIFESPGKKISPEEALAAVKSWFSTPGIDPIKEVEKQIKEGEKQIKVMAPTPVELKSSIPETSFSSFFLLNVRNIQEEIDSRIANL
jgi:DNA-binding transcriptional MerR regulator